MRLKENCSGVGFFKLSLILVIGLFSVSVHAAFLYKSYIIRKAGGQDILCDPYIVQQNDYILKIFRQRGEISNADFPKFLNLFRSINPQIRNLDKILPGQNIFIPLKILEPNSVPDQDFGVVTIPFVTGTQIDEILKNHSDLYQVQQGDTVSKILSINFGRYGTAAYKEGLSIFKAMNPQIKNVDFIVAGQKVLLPQKKLQNEPWYESLFDSSGNVAQMQPVDSRDISMDTTGEEGGGKGSGTKTAVVRPPLERAAELLDAKLYQKGTYYFPRPGRADFQLDLAKFPVLEIKGGTRVLITHPAGKGKNLSEADLAVLRNFWKDLIVTELPANASLPQVFDSMTDRLGSGSDPGRRVFSDGGIQVTVQPQWMIDEPRQDRSLAVTAIGTAREKTPQPVLDYLKKFGIVLKEVVMKDFSIESQPPADKISFEQVPELDASLDRKTFVRDFFGILGASYSQNASISFPYAGVQIQAVTNLLSRPDGLSTLIDFGDLQGDAAAAIERTGLKVLQIPLYGKTVNLVRELLSAVGMTCETNPTFKAAERSGPNNTTILVPGFLAEMNQTPRVLLATVPVQDTLVRFFHEKDIKVVALVNVTGD